MYFHILQCCWLHIDVFSHFTVPLVTYRCIFTFYNAVGYIYMEMHFLATLQFATLQLYSLYNVCNIILELFLL